MQPEVIKFFKRNPEKTVCHLVLLSTFDNAHRANLYKTAIRAKKVTVVLRSECAKELGEIIKETPVPERVTVVSDITAGALNN